MAFSGTAPFISAKTFIGWIEATSLNAFVETLNPNGTGTIGLLDITNGTFTGSYSTDFLGGPTVPGLPPNIARMNITGNLDADVFISNSIRNSSNAIDEINVGGSLVVGRTIRVGQQLQSNGVIRIGNATGLAGQIILNAANVNPNTAWAGTLNVNNAALPEEYQTLSSTLGGGASGVVPFPVHTADSGVVFGGYTGINTLLQSDFEAASTSTNLVEVEFYGPVRLFPANATELPVSILRGAECTGPDVINASPSFTAVVSGRKLFLRKAPGATTPPHGTYAVIPNTSGPSLLVCDGINGNVLVDTTQVLTFNIGRDCNNNGVMDTLELATHDTDPVDGIIDTCIETNEGDFFCIADFNYDSFIDQFDYNDFIACFECQSCPILRDADVNFDTFVDFFDYEAFVVYFETGC